MQSIDAPVDDVVSFDVACRTLGFDDDQEYPGDRGRANDMTTNRIPNKASKSATTRRGFAKMIGATILVPGCAGVGKPALDATKQLLTWQPPPPPLPGLGTLGLGYDCYAKKHRLRGRVLAFDYDVPAEMWTSSATGGIYVDPETTSRYLIPAGISFDHENQHGAGSVIVAESRAHFESQMSESLELSGSYGLASASVSESFSMSGSEDVASWYCQRTQDVILWTLWNSGPVVLDEAFAARVRELPIGERELPPGEDGQCKNTRYVGDDETSYPIYKALIDDYGVVVVERVSLGGRIEFNYRKMTKEDVSAMDVRAELDASYAGAFSAKGQGAYSSTLDEGETQSETRIRVLGGDASEAGMLMDNGGSTLEWSKTVSNDPAIMTNGYTPIYEIVGRIPTESQGEGGFTLTAAERRDKRKALRNAVFRYSREAFPVVRVRIRAGRKRDGSTLISLGHGAVAGDAALFPGPRFPCIRTTVISSKSLLVVQDHYFLPYESSMEESDPVVCTPTTGDATTQAEEGPTGAAVKPLSDSHEIEQTVDAIVDLLDKHQNDIVVIATCIDPALFASKHECITIQPRDETPTVGGMERASMPAGKDEIIAEASTSKIPIGCRLDAVFSVVDELLCSEGLPSPIVRDPESVCPPNTKVRRNMNWVFAGNRRDGGADSRSTVTEKKRPTAHLSITLHQSKQRYRVHHGD